MEECSETEQVVYKLFSTENGSIVGNNQIKNKTNFTYTHIHNFDYFKRKVFKMNLSSNLFTLIESLL